LVPLNFTLNPINLGGGSAVKLCNPIARLSLATLTKHGHSRTLGSIKRQRLACQFPHSRNPALPISPNPAHLHEPTHGALVSAINPYGDAVDPGEGELTYGLPFEVS
jgi:hypothetical protein